MDYFILRNQKTGEIIKIGRYDSDGIAERLKGAEWLNDPILDSEMFDGLLEQVSEVEAKRIIAFQMNREKIAA